MKILPNNADKCKALLVYAIMNFSNIHHSLYIVKKRGNNLHLLDGETYSFGAKNPTQNYYPFGETGALRPSLMYYTTVVFVSP